MTDRATIERVVDEFLKVDPFIDPDFRDKIDAIAHAHPDTWIRIQTMMHAGGASRLWCCEHIIQRLRRRWQNTQWCWLRTTDRAIRAELQETFADAPPPAIHLVAAVWTPVAPDSVAAFRSDEYRRMIVKVVAALDDARAMDLYYGSFSPSWNPYAAMWHYVHGFQTHGKVTWPQARVRFAVHYWALHDRVDALKRHNPDRFDAIALRIRPAIDRTGDGVRANAFTPRR